MGVFPASVGRVPSLLQARISLANIATSSLEMARVQERLSTGLAINRPSDDSVKAATISAINERLARGDRLLRNFQHASAALSDLDRALGEANELLLEAKTIASSQLNGIATAEERAGQAVIIDSLIQGMLQASNRRSVAGYVLGGNDPNTRPLEEFLGGVRSLARGGGLLTDIGTSLGIPITLGTGSALGSTSARVFGSVDLAPGLTGESRLADLRGALEAGVAPGVIRMTVSGSDPVEIDLTHADTAGDIVDAINASIRAIENETGRTLLGPGGVGYSNGAISIDLLNATPPDADPSISFDDVGLGRLALDMGLRSDAAAFVFDPANADGIGVNPRLTLETPLSALGGLAGSLPLGQIVLRAQGQTRHIDLSGAQSVGDITRAIEGSGLGIRATIDRDENRLVVVNEVASGVNQAMSIEDSGDGTATAGLLGIRSFGPELAVGDLNFGRGVGVVSGSVDPITGNADPSRDVDFVITLGNGFAINIDLQPEDMTTVESVVNAINAQAQAQLGAEGLPATLFVAQISTSPAGFALTQDTTDPGVTGAISVERLNNSPAAFDLGLMDRSYDPGTGTLLGDDRGRVRPENAFTAMIDLRDALLRDDTIGITIAGEKLDGAIARLAESRAVAGGQGQRLETETRFVEDRMLLDQTLRSGLADADFALEATRFSLLQTQLQAAYQTAATAGQLSLLQFLG